jgi:hypothetical protein
LNVQSEIFALLGCYAVVWYTLVHIAHFMVRIQHNRRFYCIPLVIAEITFFWGTMDIHQHSNVSRIPPQYFCHITLFHFLGVWGIPTSVFFSLSSYHVGHGGKEIVHLEFLTTSFLFLNQFCHRHALLSSVVPSSVCFSLRVLSCHKWCSVVGIFFC